MDNDMDLNRSSAQFILKSESHTQWKCQSGLCKNDSKL